MGAVSVLLLFTLPLNCTSDASRSTTPVAEPAAPPPPTPRTPLHTAADVLVAVDTAIALTDTLPLARITPPPKPHASVSALTDTTAAPQTDTAHVSDSTRGMALASSEPPTERSAAPPDDNAPASPAPPNPAPVNADEAAARTPSTPAQHRPSAPQARTSAFASAVAGTLPDNANASPGITGLVTDETRTKIGRDFYSAFYDQWEAPQSNRYYTVVVTEQPVPSLGTRVRVRVNQRVVFETRLQPQRNLVQEAAQRAVYVTQRHLQSNLSTTAY